MPVPVPKPPGKHAPEAVLAAPQQLLEIGRLRAAGPARRRRGHCPKAAAAAAAVTAATAAAARPGAPGPPP